GATRVRMVLQVPGPCTSPDDTASQSALAPVLDKYEHAIADYGVDVLLVLNNQTACIPNAGTVGELDPVAFEVYKRNYRQRVSDVAYRFRNNGHIIGYEIWNEEDDDACSDDYCPYVAADRYGQLLAEAIAAIHTFGGRVIMGGLETGQPSYVD